MFALLLALLLAVQAPVPMPEGRTDGRGEPEQDAVVVRGCLKGRTLRITEHDVAQLSGESSVRLKGSRSMEKMLDDVDGYQVAVTGRLELPPADRIETRRRRKIGSRVTVAVGARATQSEPLATPLSPTILVDSFEPIAETCEVPPRED